MKDASAIFHSEVGQGELERLSALETLKGLKNPDSVTLGDLARYLSSRGLWGQFAKITLADLRDAFSEAGPGVDASGGRRRKRRILEGELKEVREERAVRDAKDTKDVKDAPETVEEDGVSREAISRLILPFIEGNGEVTLDDIEEYTRIDRKVLRQHLGTLVKEGRLERIGVGRHAVYSAL